MSNTTGANNAPAQPYTSAEEMTNDFNDVRYTGSKGAPPDPTFVAQVRERLAAAPATPPAPPSGDNPFETAEDVIAAMGDKRYGTDPHYTAEVRERLKNVDLGVSAASRHEIRFDGKGGWIDVQQERYSAEAQRQAVALAAAQPVEIPGIGAVSPFLSPQEIAAAMNDSAYKNGDPVAHAIVRARLSITNF